MVNPLDNVRVVLANPLYSGNVGSVCRAMSNMGLHDLALVSPRPLDLDEARAMACHASDVLFGRREFATVAEAVADCGLIVGTTARTGLYRQHARPPREVAARVLETAGRSRVAIVFGREDNGLSNEEMALSTVLVQIPSAPAYPSINVAQAVMICCYELFVAAGQYQGPVEKSPEAPSQLRERMFEMWREVLLRIGFMDAEKADHMMLGLRRILGRGPLSEDDVRIMMGIARQTKWACEHGVGRQEAEARSQHADR